MKTVIIQKSNINASPLTSYESICDMPTWLASSKTVGPWMYNNTEITLPYSVNAINGHSSSYSKNVYTFTSTITIHKLQPTYLWFDHADHKAEILINDVSVTTHYGGYNSFFVDITDYIIVGTNTLTVKLDNRTTSGTKVAPISGDFNFNATLGVVKIISSPVLPAIKYGYDGFHVSADVSTGSATVTVKTSIPTYADVVCHINDDTYSYTSRKFGKGEISFTATINNPHLWDGKNDPHLYDISLELYYNDELCHTLNTAYGLRYYSYVYNDSTIDGYNENNPYTGFLLNGHPYLLRGVCMHQDIDGKANALTSQDIDHDFDILLELGANFIRTAHYPHPKQFYDYCDKLGIVVQTEVPWVNNANTNAGDTYYANLRGQYTDMVQQHFNHPSIFFWGLANEITTDDKNFAKGKIEEFRTLIRSIDTSRWVGYVVAHGLANPGAAFNYPEVDYYGCNMYIGWYYETTSNDPTSAITTRLTNAGNIPMAYSEYGCGATRTCHSDNPLSTTTRGNNPRHDIEYQMWLHEGHLSAIKAFPQLLYTSLWVLFDFAVSSRNEGYTVCLDGENTSIDESLRYLNDKGLLERDHYTKKDTFYLYKAEWNQTPFVHICGKDYQKLEDRVIKCYSNDGTSFGLYVNDALVETVNSSNHIITFTARTFNTDDVIKVTGATTEDSFVI